MSSLRVHYCHGLASGPGGYKARAIGEWATLNVPNQHMSLYHPLRTNSMLRWWLRQLPGVPVRSKAMLDALDACVQIQRAALDKPDVLVGSSWGGLVTCVMLAEGLWRGPTVLLCPATRVMERRLPGLRTGPRSADVLVQAIADLPQSVRDQICIVHGTADDVVPIEDSRMLSAQAGLRLEEVTGGSHGLSGLVPDGRLRSFIESVVP